MEKQHYIYRMFNEQTGEYYIGQRTCNGTAWLDGKYKGSGVLITKKVKAHPAQWRKEILCFAASHEMLNELEILYIGDAWRDDELCLNLCPGGMNPGPEFWTEEQRINHAVIANKYWASEENRIKQSNRLREAFSTNEARIAQSIRQKRRFESKTERDAHAARIKEQFNVRLISSEGDKVEIHRNLVCEYLRNGYTFVQSQVYVQNHKLEICCYYSGKKAVALLLADCGWTYGRNNAYTLISMKQVEESLK